MADQKSVKEQVWQLRQEANFQLKKAQEAAHATDADGGLSDAQIESIRGYEAKADELTVRADKLEAAEKLRRNIDERLEEGSRSGQRKLPVDAGSRADDGSMRFNGSIELPGLPSRRYAAFGAGAKAEERAYRSGLWAIMNIFGKNSQLADRPEVENAKRQIRDYFPEMMGNRALATTPNTAGGALVPTELADAIVELREQFGVFERVARRVPVTGEGLWPKVTSDDMAAFGAEGGNITETDPTFGQISLKPKQLSTMCRINNQLLASTPIDIGQFLADEFGRRFAKRLDTAGFDGNGEAANGGILGAQRIFENTTTLVGSRAVAGGTADAPGEITTSILADLFGVLPQYAAPGAMIFAHRETIEGVFGRLQQAAGGVTKAETALGTLPTYNGYPLVATQVMNTTSSGDYTTNDTIMLLGDMRMAAYFGVAREMEFMTSSERYFDTNQTGVRGIMFCDINVHDYGSTSAAGSLVALRSA